MCLAGPQSSSMQSSSMQPSSMQPSSMQSSSMQPSSMQPSSMQPSSMQSSSMQSSSMQSSSMQPSRALSARSSADTSSGQDPLWRPWLFTSTHQCARNQPVTAEPRPTLPGCSSLGRKLCFQHPVRLFWPKSKSYDHLYSDGEALLNNFPVQATISLYDSESEDESEEGCEEQDVWME